MKILETEATWEASREWLPTIQPNKICRDFKSREIGPRVRTLKCAERRFNLAFEHVAKK